MEDSGVIQIIEYSTLEEINTSSDVKIETQRELDVFLRFEHDLGNIVFFNTEKLRAKVVLDPEWLIAGVGILISPSLHLIEDHPELHPQWYDFKDTGRLSESLIDHLWVEDENEDFHKNRDHLLNLMERLSIIEKPVEKDRDLQDQKPYYWVPCVIYKSAPDHVKNPKTCEGMTRTSTLCFVSKTKFIHIGVFYRLVASFLSKFRPAEEDREYRLYGGCCEFEIDNRHNLYVALNDYIIHATIFRYSSKGEDPDNELCSQVRSFIYSTLVDISACITPNSEFDICVKCDRSTDSIKGLLSISDGEEIRCKCSKPFHPVKVANLLKFWEQTIDPSEVDQIHSVTSDITRHREDQTSSRRRTLPHGKKYHVFFSYTNFDMPWVKETVEKLEKDHGFVCCEYDRDNTPGTPLLNFASDSIHNAHKTVVVMTREAFRSGFVVLEIDIDITQSFKERRKCVVPVLLEDCEIPSKLSILNFVDARDPKRRDIWWPKLLTELGTQGEEVFYYLCSCTCSSHEQISIINTELLTKYIQADV
ncbi:hypothetical protein CHS0354_025309 [Potamilus streckersoni]|uniref:TIR domain-containing protein n=1 Tax=Potamilus streckersoni TaxID=2493646 RepID=A0AAE0VIW8_9BIVA|nr:hypothetical protein CHS0354_025309 [Potamilus streckersoni]